MDGESYDDLLKRYIDMRSAIDSEVSTIQSIAHVLALLRYCDMEEVSVDPIALGYLHLLIEQSSCSIHSQLEDFVGLSHAKNTVACSINNP